MIKELGITTVVATVMFFSTKAIAETTAATASSAAPKLEVKSDGKSAEAPAVVDGDQESEDEVIEDEGDEAADEMMEGDVEEGDMGGEIEDEGELEEEEAPAVEAPKPATKK